MKWATDPPRPSLAIPLLGQAGKIRVELEDMSKGRPAPVQRLNTCRIEADQVPAAPPPALQTCQNVAKFELIQLEAGDSGRLACCGKVTFYRPANYPSRIGGQHGTATDNQEAAARHKASELGGLSSISHRRPPDKKQDIRGKDEARNQPESALNPPLLEHVTSSDTSWVLTGQLNVIKQYAHMHMN